MNTSDRAILDGIRGSLTREIGRYSQLSDLLWNSWEEARALYRRNDALKLIEIRDQVDVFINNSIEVVSFDE